MALTDLTDEQKTQHEAVLQVAMHNLLTVKDSVESLDDPAYDAVLESLESVQGEIEKRQIILSRGE